MRRFNNEARPNIFSDDENELDEDNLYDQFEINRPKRTPRWPLHHLSFSPLWSYYSDTQGIAKGFRWLSHLIASVVRKFVSRTPQRIVSNPTNIRIMYDNRSPFNPNAPNIPVYFENSPIPVILSLNELRAAKYPEYARYERRLRSFDTWPAEKIQTKELLAGAGFFYTGEGDQTNCYYCGLGLFYWLPDDDPIREHSRWSPRCKHNLEALRLELIKQSIRLPRSRPF